MTVHAPIPDYTLARQAMVDSQLRPQGVNDPAVIEAMSSVPREQFVPEELKPLAYVDRAIPLGEGRAMAPAAVLGLLLTALAPERGERALVVGGGTGYAAAILKTMGVEAISVESSATLVGIARGHGLEVIEGPLEDGYGQGAPFDFVLIDGAVEIIPDTLVEQLKDRGRLAGAIVDKGITRLIIGRRAGGGFGHLTIADAATPTLPGFERPKAFTF